MAGGKAREAVASRRPPVDGAQGHRQPKAVGTRRGHHRHWTGGSRQEPSERPPPGELVDASLWAGLEGDPADDEVPEDLPRLGNLPPQHRPPVGQAVADLALQARDLVAADPRGRVQLNQRSLAPLALRLAFLECRQEGRQVAAARDRRRESAELAVQAAHLPEDLVASSFGRVATRAQLVNRELDRSLDHLTPEQIALE